MIGFWENDNLIKSIDEGIKESRVPHCHLINDSYGSGGILLGMTIAEKLLGKDPFKHPDFNIYFPLEKDDISENSIERFKYLFKKINCCGLSDWNQILNSNVQSQIRVKDITNLHEKILLKAYEGKNKVYIIWGPELLNERAGNKLLKILEEPPSRTYFILVSEKINQILPTIISRSIILNLSKLSFSHIEKSLKEMQINDASGIARAANGSWRKALQLSDKSNKIEEIESIWIKGLRGAFKSSENKKIVVELMGWAEKTSSLTRDEQKQFLEFGSNLIRSALVLNYKAKEASYYYSFNNFNVEKLAPFIHSKNILKIINLIDKTHYEISRNANVKILFFNFILKIAKYLNMKEY